MSVQVYAGGRRIYDSRIPVEQQVPLLSAHIKEGLNKGGTASLVLPPLHPDSDAFPAYAVPVEIYRNGALRWRGRPLPGSSDVYGRRTITCEGELCFLQDSSCRPYAYTAKPESIFATLIGIHNAAVEPWKRFAVGVVSVGSNSDVTLSAKEPEQVFAAVSKLRQMCGGYILIDSAADGTRRINWFKDLPYLCKQKIKLGYNLTNYSTRPDSAVFATRIIPYGDYGEDGKRIQISVDGKDYVEDSAAVQVYGVVEKSVIYNGVISATELETLARADLAKAASLPETISLTAVDMSRIDASIGSFAIGQRVEAESAPHNLSGRYDLVELEEDLIQPTIGAVTVTRDAAAYVSQSGTLTGAIHQQAQQIQQKPTQSAMEQAVAAATAWLTNGQGYVVDRRDAAGNRVDTLYMDTPDINTAVKVLRVGQSGFGFSQSGVDGPYLYAFTLDGKFNASCIASGSIVSEGMTYLPPTHSDVMDMLWSATFPDMYPPKDYYDLNGDGVFTIEDFRLAQKVFEGKVSIMDCAGAKQTRVTVAIEPFNSDCPLKISGRNMWGSEVVVSLGTSGSQIPMLKGNCAIGGKLTVGSNAVVPALALDSTETPKNLSWRQNEDGTYSLIGTDPAS